MKTIRILQVGDLHFDEASKVPIDVDAKDTRLSSALVAQLGERPLQRVVRAMSTTFDTVDAVVLCGDLTSRGDLDVYGASVEYLERNFEFAAAVRWPEGSVHAVPGNHDVNRDLAALDPGDFSSKFVPLVEAWQLRSIPVLSPDVVRATTVGSEGAAVRVVSLNSCIGCGEQRAAVVDQDLVSVIEARSAAGNLSAADALFEQMDAPMFRDSDITAVGAEIAGLPATALPVLLAHHNLLPQHQPRLQIYTELVNSGAVRAQFASYDRPVLYMHGHIHSDPIEVVEQVHPHTGKIVSVSAPVLADGFNVVDIAFGQAAMPVGATITRWRYSEGGSVRPQGALRIPLRREDDPVHGATDALLTAVDDLNQARWTQVLDRVATLEPGRYEPAAIEDAAREAWWAGYLDIGNFDESPVRWIARRRLR